MTTSDKSWLSAPDFGRSLKTGLGFSLIVKDVARCVAFAENVLGATVPHWNVDFAAVRLLGMDYMLHHERTYRSNALYGPLMASEARGLGIELRVYGCDPDRAVTEARAAGFTVLAEAMDKPHGLREAVILDDEGYAWVPGVALLPGCDV